MAKICLVSSRVPVLVNGSSTKEFDMGNRQGDSLPPFLFIIVGSLLMGEAMYKNMFSNYKCDVNDTQISWGSYIG